MQNVNYENMSAVLASAPTPGLMSAVLASAPTPGLMSAV